MALRAARSARSSLGDPGRVTPARCKQREAAPPAGSGWPLARARRQDGSLEKALLEMRASRPEEHTGEERKGDEQTEELRDQAALPFLIFGRCSSTCHRPIPQSRSPCCCCSILSSIALLRFVAPTSPSGPGVVTTITTGVFAPLQHGGPSRIDRARDMPQKCGVDMSGHGLSRRFLFYQPSCGVGSSL